MKVQTPTALYLYAIHSSHILDSLVPITRNMPHYFCVEFNERPRIPALLQKIQYSFPANDLKC